MCANLSVQYIWTASDFVEAEIEINCSNETHVSALQLYMTFAGTAFFTGGLRWSCACYVYGIRLTAYFVFSN